MPVKIIEIRDLRVQYGEVEALTRVSIDIVAGDHIGIVGPNGAGKTSLIKAILGLVPFKGEIIFQGTNLLGFLKTNHIGYLPQRMLSLDQRFPATTREIVVSGVYCCKKFPKHLKHDDFKFAEEAMDILGVTSLADRMIGRLSSGQQQRILLARAIVHKPRILILDEPTVALDQQSKEMFYSTIEKLNREKGVTVLHVSHDIGSVGKYAPKLLYLDRCVVFYGTPEEFCKSSKMTDHDWAGQHMICHRY